MAGLPNMGLSADDLNTSLKRQIMNRTARWVLGLAVLVGISSFESDGITLAAVSETIDFEAESEGDQNPAVFGSLGSGPIATSADGVTARCPDADTAIIYDTTSGNGGDTFDLDLQSQQGNVLVIEEDLADGDADGDPDDCETGGDLTIDFSGVDAAGVTAESVKVLDIEQATGANTIELLGPGDAFITSIDIPNTGDGGITGPINLGPTAGVVKMVFHFVTSGAVDDLVFTPPDRGREGCTPGKWKNWTGLGNGNQSNHWAATGYTFAQTVGSVFTGVDASLAATTLLEALDGGGGPGDVGKQKILLRAAVAALLNASHPGVAYPLTEGEIIADVNAALAAGGNALTDLATELDDYNNLGCSLPR
jgi:hypothetical protein